MRKYITINGDTDVKRIFDFLSYARYAIIDVDVSKKLKNVKGYNHLRKKKIIYYGRDRTTGKGIIAIKPVFSLEKIDDRKFLVKLRVGGK